MGGGGCERMLVAVDIMSLKDLIQDGGYIGHWGSLLETAGQHFAYESAKTFFLAAKASYLTRCSRLPLTRLLLI